MTIGASGKTIDEVTALTLHKRYWKDQSVALTKIASLQKELDEARRVGEELHTALRSEQDAHQTGMLDVMEANNDLKTVKKPPLKHARLFPSRPANRLALCSFYSRREPTSRARMKSLQILLLRIKIRNPRLAARWRVSWNSCPPEISENWYFVRQVPIAGKIAREGCGYAAPSGLGFKARAS